MFPMVHSIFPELFMSYFPGKIGCNIRDTRVHFVCSVSKKIIVLLSFKIFTNSYWNKFNSIRFYAEINPFKTRYCETVALPNWFCDSFKIDPFTDFQIISEKPNLNQS